MSRCARKAVLAALGLVSVAVLARGPSSVAVLARGPSSVAVAAQAEPRVILISWDGAGHVMTSKLLAEGRLPNLARMIREGAWSDGMVSSFPTKTAAAHAMLFTGHYGHTSGITGNALLRRPLASHDRSTTENGYFANALAVDPVWVRAARAGRRAFTLHATQAFPFDASLAGIPRETRDRLYLVHGYTDVQIRGEVLDDADAPLRTPGEWTIPEARGGEARAMQFAVGDSSFHGVFFDDPLDPRVGHDTLGIVRTPADSSFVARIQPGEAGGFSVPIRATEAGEDVWFSLRLFEADVDAGTFVLYRSGAVELAHSNETSSFAGLPTMRVFAGNSGSRSYRSGAFGPTRPRGGSGVAESRFRETLAHLQEQIVAQSRHILAEDYRLSVFYSPVTDDVAHELTGHVDPALAGYDEEVAAALWEDIAFGFELQDRWLGQVLDTAAEDGAHVVLVSDHGMAGTDRLVHVNVALAEAGLLSRRRDGTIDLGATRALMPPTTDASVAVNTVDRLSGIVPLEERDAVLEEVRRVLGAIRDPDSGEPVIPAFYLPSTEGLLQPGGSSTGDVFLEFLYGYYPSSSTRGDVVVERTEPVGNHIFVPTRGEMLAIFAAWGPRVRSGENWGKVRAIDVTPTVLDLLELDPAPELPGRSLARPRTLLDRP